MDKNRHIALLILDGWGVGTDPKADAIAAANTPFIDGLLTSYPHAQLTTYGPQVGLPAGQMGNSEVGHLNIGAGRVVYQELLRINNAIDDRSFYENRVLIDALDHALTHQKNVHLLGLLSDGGVHSHINHVKALIDLLQDYPDLDAYIHAFTDGRDVDPRSGHGYIQDILDYTQDTNTCLASLIGRYYAMDRDHRWERTKKAYDLLIKQNGYSTRDVLDQINNSYHNGITDEFLEPISVLQPNGRHAIIEDGDVVIFFNFRTDRPRQLTEVLHQHDMPEHEMKKLDLYYVTMTEYSADFDNVQVAFTKDNLTDTIGDVIAREGLTQVRIAETEKYPHVTFFFNGGREKAFVGEDRILIPSPKVATYDLQPEMSAVPLTDAIINKINDDTPNFVCLNYANTDMVGHTGDFKAAQIAAETVDQCLSRLVPTLLRHDYDIIIIADHGNSDYMINTDGTPNTAHTTNPVPVIYVANHAEQFKIANGKLADLAPTLLQLINIQPPELMTGQQLISKK
ncbi:UNVERIFIED_CONTAM: hypothetical protein GTU68_067344 [Idotea baltica]|nr:hypothetical protein [Idotea baltica]